MSMGLAVIALGLIWGVSRSLTDLDSAGAASSESVSRNLVQVRGNMSRSISTLEFSSPKFQVSEDLLKLGSGEYRDQLYGMKLSPGYSYYKGLEHFKANRFLSALPCLQRATRLDPGNAQTHLTLGMTTGKHGLDKVAQEELQTLRTMSPALAEQLFQYMQCPFGVGV